MTVRRVLLIAACAASLGACAVGPNYKTPALPPTSGYGAAGAPGEAGPRLVSGMDVARDWWRVFGSRPLDALVDEALKHNPTIDQARATLHAAREATLAQRGAYFPTVEASLQPTRQQFAKDLSSPTESGASLYTLTTSQVSVSFAPDIFGANRRAVENLGALEDAQRFELEAARQTIAANVALAAIQDAALRAQIGAARSVIQDQQRALDSFRRQRELGQASDADVAAQTALLAQAQTALPPLEKAFEVNRDLLAALVGRTPGEPVTATFDLDALTLPDALPLSLPADLVRQRPDVRAAEAQLHAASAEIGVAVAARLPDINLAANAGSAPLDLGVSLANSATFWSLAGTLTQPIFQGGTLLHHERGARAAFDAAAAQYRATVIAAFQNTADTVHALRFDAKAAVAAQSSADAAAHSLTIAHKQLGLGDISPLIVLAAEQADAQARLALAQARATQYSDAVALFQALGGGWWNAPPDKATGAARP